MFIASSPNWANRVNYVSCFKIAAGCDYGITHRATANPLAFFINLWTPLE